MTKTPAPGASDAAPLPPLGSQADRLHARGRDHTNVYLFLTYLVLVLAFSLLYPPLNWPDEPYQINRAFTHPNAYLFVVRLLSGTDCQLGYLRNAVPYGGNSFDVDLLRGTGCYMQLKIANVLGIAVTALVGLWIAPRGEARRVYLLSLIWPACVFYVTGINQHVVFQTIALAVASRVVVHGHAWRVMLLTIPLLLIDRSAITLLAFLGVLGAIQFSGRLGVVVGLAMLAMGHFAPGLVAFIPESVIGPEAATLAEILTKQSDGIVFSLALFMLSFVYLGGTSTIFGIGLDYALVIGVLIVLLVRERRSRAVWVHAAAFLTVYLAVVSVVPTIQTFRYYPYVLPVLIALLLRQPWMRSWYAIYAVVMAPVYIGMALWIAYS